MYETTSPPIEVPVIQAKPVVVDTRIPKVKAAQAAYDKAAAAVNDQAKTQQAKAKKLAQEYGATSAVVDETMAKLRKAKADAAQVLHTAEAEDRAAAKKK